MKTHGIFTFCDAHCGDFLVRHWSPSLRDAVNLRDIDVHIFDYGLTQSQCEAVQAHGFSVHSYRKEGFIGCVFLRDLARYLAGSSYDQVLVVDDGDLIFQDDISHLFEEHKDRFRAVCEQTQTFVHQLFMSHEDIVPEKLPEMLAGLQGKPTINLGFLLGPANKFRALWSDIELRVRDLHQPFTVQFVSNYLLHRDGFHELDSKYNFVLISAKSRYSIRAGVFLDEEEKPIPVVHNAGGKKWKRFVANFGYGKNCNRKKWLSPFFHRLVFRLLNWWRTTSPHPVD